MDAYMILFRIIHIASAMLWFGAAVFYTAFIGPTLALSVRRDPASSAHWSVRQKQ